MLRAYRKKSLSGEGGDTEGVESSLGSRRYGEWEAAISSRLIMLIAT